jgi:hypothetical protein
LVLNAIERAAEVLRAPAPKRIDAVKPTLLGELPVTLAAAGPAVGPAAVADGGKGPGEGNSDDHRGKRRLHSDRTHDYVPFSMRNYMPFSMRKAAICPPRIPVIQALGNRQNATYIPFAPLSACVQYVGSISSNL